MVPVGNREPWKVIKPGVTRKGLLLRKITVSGTEAGRVAWRLLH